MLAFCAASATEPLIPQLLKKALDDGFASQDSFPLWMAPVALIGLFALRGLLTFVGSYLLSRAASLTVFSLRQDLTAALLKADGALFNRLSPGLAVAQVVNDPQVMSTQLTSAALTLLRDGTAGVALLGYLFWLNWKLTLLALTVVPLLSWSVRRVHGRIRDVSARTYDVQNQLVGIIDDLARSWRVVRIFGAEQFEKQRATQAAREVQRGTLKAAAAAAMMTPVSQTMASLGVAAIVTLALVQGRSGETSVGTFASYVAALLLMVSRVRHLTDVSQPIVNALVLGQSIFSLMDTPPEPDEGSHDPGRARGDLKVQGLTVRYPSSEAAALQGTTLDIPAGQTTGLVGSSGAGKSTLVSALLAMVEPAQGQVLLDGVDVREWRKSALRRQFAVVSQDIVLFDDSVAANVAYASPLDEARLETCLRAAALWDVVQAMPEGTATRVGVNGSKLSGGQRQRLAIARALYKDAPVWIFDEATSALDSESEHAIQQALQQWRGQRTLIVIAHRLSTLRDADQICVLEGGRVVEAGRDEDLMAQGGRYAHLVSLQQAPGDRKP